MNIGKAFAVFQQIESKKYTKDEKYEAIHDVINAATINSITKKQVLNVVSWLFNKQQRGLRLFRKITKTAYHEQQCSMMTNTDSDFIKKFMPHEVLAM